MYIVKSKTPKLRFPEFSNEWDETSLGTKAKFLKGKGISKSDISEDGKIECIRYGELYTEYNELIKDIKSRTNLNRNELILSESNDVIIPASGETHIDIATASCVLKKGVALGGDLNIIKTKNDGVFLAYYLNNKKRIDIARLAQGNSVVHLYSSQLKSLNLLLPKIAEQQKIASFLTAVDDKIQQLTKKKDLLEKYKKGVMQKIFSQEIRFKPALSGAEVDDDGNDYPDWEEKIMEETATFYSGGTPTSTNKNYYSGDIPFIGSGDISNQSVTQYITKEALKNSSAKMVNIGDLLYALYGATSGEVAISKINGAINQAILCIRTKNNVTFLFHWLSFMKARIISTFLQGGQGNLSAQIIKKLKLRIPSDSEQNKIADFLSSIDKKIESVNTQLEKTKEFKKGLLQQMFV